MRLAWPMQFGSFSGDCDDSYLSAWPSYRLGRSEGHGLVGLAKCISGLELQVTWSLALQAHLTYTALQLSTKMAKIWRTAMASFGHIHCPRGSSRFLNANDSATAFVNLPQHKISKIFDHLASNVYRCKENRLANSTGLPDLVFDPPE